MNAHCVNISLAFGILLISTCFAYGQRAKDPCESIKIRLTSSNGADFTLAEINKNRDCLNGSFVRVIGIFRVAFENSDFYDPANPGASAWLTFEQFSPAVKRCSSRENLSRLGRKDGGTFGLVALGIIKTTGRHGHMGGWDNEFQVICIEKAKVLSENGYVFASQPESIQKKILGWYNDEVRKLY